jgi:septal ring factor EnvC (AmiA/AmiB activator)
MNASPSFSRKLAIALIVCAVFGTEVSYHFTLESRFEAIEQKLAQSTAAVQQMQDSIDTLSTSKTQTVAGLNRQIEALQSSFAPLGKMSHEQMDALSQVRQEIVTLQQAQTEQVEAQKKLSTGITQLETARNEARLVAAAASPAPEAAPAATVPAPATVATPAAVPSTSSASSAHALFQFPGAFSKSTKVALLPAASNTSDAMDVRPADDASGDTFRSVRALPVDGSIAR